jgi:hypothetical protein
VHLQEKTSYKATVRDTALAAFDAAVGVPRQLSSCHTTKIAGYLVVGHVPADVIQRLTREKPADIVGIAVPGMPAGSPGMEVPGRADSYNIIAWDRQGRTRVYDKR